MHGRRWTLLPLLLALCWRIDAPAAETSLRPPADGFDPLVARYHEDAASGVLLSSYSSVIESNSPTPYELRTPEGILVPLRGQKNTAFDNLRLVTRRGEDFLKVERNSDGCLDFEWAVGQFQNVSRNHCLPHIQVAQLGGERSTEWVGQPVLRDTGEREVGPSALTSSMVVFRIMSQAGVYSMVGARIDWQSITLHPLYAEQPGRNTCEVYNLGSDALLSRVCDDCGIREKCTMEILKLEGDKAQRWGAVPTDVLDITSRPIERILGEHWMGVLLDPPATAAGPEGEDDAVLDSGVDPGLLRLRIDQDGFSADTFPSGAGVPSRLISMTRDVFGRLVMILDQDDGCTRLGQWQPDLDQEKSGVQWLTGCTDGVGHTDGQIGAWNGRGRPRLLLTDPGGTTWMYVAGETSGHFVPLLIGDTSSFSLYVPRFFTDGAVSAFALHSLESLGFSRRPVSMSITERDGRVFLNQQGRTWECSGGFCLRSGDSSDYASSVLDYSRRSASSTSPIGPFTVARDTRRLERSVLSAGAQEWSITCERMRQSLSGRPTSAVACTRIPTGNELDPPREAEESLVLLPPGDCAGSSQPFVYIDRKYALWMGCGTRSPTGETLVSPGELWVVPGLNGPLGTLVHIESSLSGFGGWQSPFDADGRWQPTFRELSFEVKKSWATELLGDTSWHMSQLQFPRRIWVNTLGTVQLTTVWSNGEGSYVESTNRPITPLRLEIGLVGAACVALMIVALFAHRERRRRRNLEERWKRERMLERLYVNPLYASRFPTPGPPVRGSIRTGLSIDASIIDFLSALRPDDAPLGVLVLTGPTRTGKTSTAYAAIEVLQGYQLPGRAWVGALVQGSPPGQALEHYLQRLARNLGIMAPIQLPAARRAKLIDEIVLKLSGRPERWEVIIAIDEWNQWLAEGTGSSAEQRADWRALIDRLRQVACVRVIVLGPGIETGARLHAPAKWTEMFGAYELSVVSLETCSVQEIMEMLSRGFREEGLRVNDLRQLAARVHACAGQNIWIANRICLGLSQHLRKTHPIDGNVHIDKALEVLEQRLVALEIDTIAPLPIVRAAHPGSEAADTIMEERHEAATS